MVLNATMADSVSALAPYHLTPEQVQFFDDNGYLVLKNRIPADMLEKLQQAATRWIERGWTVDANNPDSIDWHFAERASGRVMFRVNYVHNKQEAVSLELLGSPYILGIAESLAGPNFVPTYESMVFKQEGDGEAIKWHQDAVHPRKYRIFNVDIYLDASIASNGALRVIPKSQVQGQDICKLSDDYGWTPPGVVCVELGAGDVLIHDVMVVHGSPQVENNTLRRTLYYEFRAAEEIIEEGPWDRTWIDQRLRLIPLALKRFEEAFPAVPSFDWKIAPEFMPTMSADESEELRIVHTVHTSGSWCSAGDAGKAKK